MKAHSFRERQIKHDMSNRLASVSLILFSCLNLMLTKGLSEIEQPPSDFSPRTAVALFVLDARNIGSFADNHAIYGIRQLLTELLTVLFISGKLQINNSVIHFKFCKEDRSSDTLTVGICYKIACFHRNAVDVSSAVLSCDHGMAERSISMSE